MKKSQFKQFLASLTLLFLSLSIMGSPTTAIAKSASIAASADLFITKIDGVTTATPGGSVTYTIIASNAGPSDATGAIVADTFPTALLTVDWICVGAGGGTCAIGTHSGDINDTVNLPAGGSVTYTAFATIDVAATGSLSNTATVKAPAGVTDPDPSNDSATDTDTLLAPKITVTPTRTQTLTPTITPTITRTSTITPTKTPVSNSRDLIWNQSYSIKYDTWFGVKSGNAMGQGYRKAVSGTFTFAPGTAFTQLNWITYRGPDQGKADLYIDGVLKATLNLYHATAQWQYAVSITGLSYKKHVVVIKPLNSKSAASSGRWIVVDGFTLGAGGAMTTVYDDQLIYMTNTFGYGSWFGIFSPGGAFSGAFRLSNIRNATTSFFFNGTQMTWVTARGPAYGKAQIWVDGVLKQTVDLYRSTQQWQYKITISGLTVGTHNVVIKVLGTKNPAASDDGVVVDGFVIGAPN